VRFPGICALLLLAGCSLVSGPPKGASQLTLRDPLWERVNVEIVVTRGSDCDKRGPEFISRQEVVMRKGKTESFDLPPEATVCWRHDRNPDKPKPGDWTGWSKATLLPGQSAETDL
jgi:hypothetical protein